MQENSALNPDWVAALSLIKIEADTLNIPFMVIGASARDILLDASQISPVRATRDVDLAIEIASWERFEELKAALINIAAFKPDSAMQRLIFDNRLPIDLVPYGAIETNAKISWPPDHAILMSVAGMRDVFDASITFELAENLSINVASASGILLLKLLAWESRKHSTSKDAEDFYFLLPYYIDLGNKAHLADNHIDLFDDIDTANPRLLRRDLRSVCSAETLHAVKTILNREISDADESLFIRHMLSRRTDTLEQRLCEQRLRALREELNG
ncbi:hypothetical protein EOL70_15035 [Leucothrix sargassi]|nr:hypothetical protein EOL70_15035 [Leucothrix sargassi]